MYRLDKIINIGIEYYQFGTVIVDKQENCRKSHFNARHLGMMYRIVKACNLLTCTNCYNYKLLKLQKETIGALEKIIKDEEIALLLKNFKQNKEDSLIHWIERNRYKLDTKLIDFKAIFLTLSPKNINADITFEKINQLKNYAKLVYKNIKCSSGEFTLFDFEPSHNGEINVHSHSIILLDKNAIFTSDGKDLRYNANGKIRSILSDIGYTEENETAWIKTYYDLFKIIAYIKKPRPEGFDKNIDTLSWLKVAISLYYDNGAIRRFRNYTMTGILSQKRSQNNKDIKQNKLLKEVKTAMSVKKDDFIQFSTFQKKLLTDKIKKEIAYSYNNTGFIILPKSENDDIYKHVELYKKRPDIFEKTNADPDNTRISAILKTTGLSVSKIKNLLITTRDGIECINGRFRETKLTKRKNGKFQRVYCWL